MTHGEKLVALAQRRNSALREVERWRDAETTACRVARNGDAPGWEAYISACEALQEALADVGFAP